MTELARRYYVVTMAGVPGFHVVCRQTAHPDWLRILATFPSKERAENYCFIENDIGQYDEEHPEDGGKPSDDVTEAPPAAPAPPDPLKPWLHLRDMDALEIERLQGQLAGRTEPTKNITENITAIAAPAPAEAASDGGEENAVETASSPPDQPDPCPQADPSTEATSAGVPPPAEADRDNGAASDAEAPIKRMGPNIGPVGRGEYDDLIRRLWAENVSVRDITERVGCAKGTIEAEMAIRARVKKLGLSWKGTRRAHAGDPLSVPISKQTDADRERAIEAQRRAKATPTATQPGHSICRGCGEEFQPASPDALHCPRCVSRVAGAPKQPTNLSGGKWQ